MRSWQHLMGKRVVVISAGVEYRGTVLELGERSLLLRAAGGHREIPWARVTQMREDRGERAIRRPSILG